MKKLDDSINANKGQYTLNPNTENCVAARLICMGKLSIDKEHKQIIKTELKNHRKMLKPYPILDNSFTQDEAQAHNVIKKSKPNKAASFDGV